MKNIGAIDVGGTSIKYGVWNGSQLVDQGSFPTPKDLDGYYEGLTKVVDKMKEDHEIIGVGMSTPGCPDKEQGIIFGKSALSYIHYFPIQQELEKRFGLPISMENDANCAALAELRFGAGKGMKNLLFFIIGTGVGGSVIFDGKVHHGKHLFGGEFGFMLMEDYTIMSSMATAVAMAKKYSERINDGKQYTGEEVFALAFGGDEIAKEEADVFFFNLTKGIFNLSFSFDPDLVILGGGVSNAPFLLDEVKKRMAVIQEKVGYTDWTPEIVTCHFKSDANLIGAVVDFMAEQNL